MQRVRRQKVGSIAAVSRYSQVPQQPSLLSLELRLLEYLLELPPLLPSLKVPLR
jgi:hypothetical protein